MKKISSFISLFLVIIISVVSVTFISPKQTSAQNIGSLQSIVTPGFSFKKDLILGDTDPDIRELQRVLNADVDTIVATEGAGSRGQETTYFGNATKAAVIKFQNKYKSVVLSLNNITVADGLVNKATRTRLNLLVGVINTYDSIGLPQNRPSAAVYIPPAPVVATSNAANCQFVELLISIGAILPEKSTAARAAFNCPAGNFVDLKINGQNGPLTVVKNSALNISWTTSGVSACSSGGVNKTISGSENYTIGTTGQTFTLTCRTAAGANISDSVLVNISATAGTPPSIVSSEATPGYSLVIIDLTTNVPTRAYITYRTNSSDAKTVSFTELKTTRTEIITGLVPNTTYYAKLRIVDASGNEYISEEATFITSDDPADVPVIAPQSTSSPRIISSSVTPDSTSAKIDIDTDVEVITTIFYGRNEGRTVTIVSTSTATTTTSVTASSTTASGTATTTATTTITTSTTTHTYANKRSNNDYSNPTTFSLVNLYPETTYYYTIMVTDKNGNFATSTEQTFDTLVAAPVVPVTAEIPIQDEGAGIRSQFQGWIKEVKQCYSDSGGIKDRFQQVIVAPCKNTVPVVGRVYENDPATGVQKEITGSQYGLGSISTVMFLWNKTDNMPLPEVKQGIVGGTAHPKADAFAEKCPKVKASVTADLVKSLTSGVVDGGWLGTGYKLTNGSECVPPPPAPPKKKCGMWHDLTSSCESHAFW